MSPSVSWAGITTLAVGGILNVGAGLSLTWGYETTTLTSIVSVISAAIPLTTAILGHLFFKERLIKTQYAGIALIVLGTGLLFLT